MATCTTVAHPWGMPIHTWSTRFRARLLLVLAIVGINATCFVAIKAGLPSAPPLRFAGLRLLIAGAVMLAILPVVRQPLRLPRRTWAWLAVLALGPTAVAYGAMFLSPQRTGAGLASVIGNLQPLIIVGLAAAVLGERMTAAKWTALILGSAGVALVAVPAVSTSAGVDPAGIFLALASSSTLAIGSVLVKRMGPDLPILTLTTWQLMLGSVPLLIASALFERSESVTWSAGFLALLIYLAVAATAFVTAAWYVLLQHGDVGRLSTTFFLVPVLGLLLSMLFFGESVSPFEGGGAALIVAGIAATARESWRESREPGRTGERSALPVPGSCVCWRYTPSTQTSQG